ncbi:amidase [Tsuneonella deserti]|uniref:Amidase n=1 Tax=Tsuneonella deserti TaxID=2035528 RepID=A0ABQ1SBN6_9SPHN|nr:amidase [Tsuneonella deserti]GGD99203.1 amidase [Tsuneonella deserti]
MKTALSSAAALLALAAPLQARPADDAKAYAKRIAAIDDSGPMLNSVIVYDRDAARKSKAAANIGPLHGRTVLVKDNIETREWPTTAGSLALAGNMTGRDAPLITRLRAAGGVVLGKTNLSEWANIRSSHSTSGWSAVGGLTKNPHATDRNSCGSSSGSGAAVAAGLAWAAIGTETDGSITCPASVNGVVGFKPTVGLVSRTHVVPISSTQDTAGPMTRSVADAALLLDAIAGSDPSDSATASADRYAGRFTAGLAGASLKGMRIGVLRKQAGTRADVLALFDRALADMKAAGAELVEIEYAEPDAMYEAEGTVLYYELREGLADYLRSSPADIPIRSLDDAIAFNKAHASEEMRWFGQETFELAQKATDRAAYEKARAEGQRLAGKEGIDRLLKENRVAVLVAPTGGPAWPSDLVYGDNFPGGIGAGSLAAIAGYPHLTVPMGAVERLPVGLSFLGAQWDDLEVLRIGAAYEAARSAALPVPSFRPWSPAP